MVGLRARMYDKAGSGDGFRGSIAGTLLSFIVLQFFSIKESNITFSLHSHPWGG